MGINVMDKPDPIKRKRRCADCAFGKVGYSYGELECRRHSPTSKLEYYGEEKITRPVKYWPIVRDNDWCGDFEFGEKT